MFKKSQYLKKSAAHRQLTKLANAAQVIRVNRRLAKKAGAGMGDVVVPDFRSVGGNRPIVGPYEPSPANPKPAVLPVVKTPGPKEPFVSRDLVIKHTNPLPPPPPVTSPGPGLAGIQRPASNRLNPTVRYHNPYYNWDPTPGFYMMQAPFVDAVGKVKLPWGQNFIGNEMLAPGVHHSFDTVILNEAQHRTLPFEERIKYTRFNRDGQVPLFARPMSSARSRRMNEESAQSIEANRAMRWLLENNPGGSREAFAQKDDSAADFLGLGGSGPINYIARVPLKTEQYENGQWVFAKRPDETDEEYNYRYALALNNAANAAVDAIVKSPDYWLFDANCHLATMNGILNNPYLRAVKGSTGGLRGASGTTGNLADSKLYQNFALATASDEEVKDAARYRDWAEANRSWKQWLEGPGGWLGMPGKLYGSLTMGY